MIRQQCSNTLQNIDQYWPVPVSLSPAVTTSVSRKDLPPRSELVKLMIFAEITGFSEFYKAEGWLSTTNDIPDEDSVVTGCHLVEVSQRTMAGSIPLLSQGCVHSWIQKRLLLLHTDPRCRSDSKMVSRLWNRCPRLPEIMDLSCSPNWGEHQGAIKLPRQTFSFAMNLPFGLECWSRGSYIWSGLFCSDFRSETCTFWALCICRHLSLLWQSSGKTKLPKWPALRLCFAWMVAAFYFAFVISKASIIFWSCSGV